MLRLPRLGCCTRKSTPPAATDTPAEASPRCASPRSGCSIFSTSAPQSASTAAALGTNQNCATSRTRPPVMTPFMMTHSSTVQLDPLVAGETPERSLKRRTLFSPHLRGARGIARFDSFQHVFVQRERINLQLLADRPQHRDART